MAVKKGRGLLMVFVDVAGELEDEFNRWYNEEHIDERLAIPGVLSAARYVAIQGSPKYLAFYELDEAEAYYSDTWKNILANPTDWSKRMSPTVIGKNFIRNVYRMIYPDALTEETIQADMSPAVLIGRMSVPPALDAKFNEAYNTERLPECYKVPGYIRNRRFEAVEGTPKYMTVHEIESPEVAETTDWKAWSAMVTPVWNTEVRPHMVHESGSPGVYRKIYP